MDVQTTTPTVVSSEGEPQRLPQAEFVPVESEGGLLRHMKRDTVPYEERLYVRAPGDDCA